MKMVLILSNKKVYESYTELILKGISQGDQIGGPLALAKILSSLKSHNKFDEDDVRLKYFKWWQSDAFDTGPFLLACFQKLIKV